jgi:hypothetical protein
VAYADTLYSARLGFEDLEQGRDNVLKITIERDGSAVTPTAGTITIYRPSGTKLVDAVAATALGSTSTYTLTNATTSSETLSDGWSVEWSLTAAGSVHVFRTDGALVRRKLYPTVADADIAALVPALDPSASNKITSATTHQGHIDEAWRRIQRRLQRKGIRPWIIVDAHAFHDAHLYLTISLILADLGLHGGGVYLEEAARYRQEHEAAWNDVRYRVDTGQDGGVDSDRRRRPASSGVWLGGGPSWRR